MLISDQYRAENARQHTQTQGYGERGYKHLDDVLHILRREKCQSALDYGCGKGTLSKYARRVCEVPIANYDPSIPEFAVEPQSADLLICTDVLEHVEPLALQDVLEHMHSLCDKAFYFQIACRPAQRILSDGRNAHLLIQPPYFWFDTLRRHFDVTDFRAMPGHSVVVCGKARGVAYE
jgi:2-polyprenyl-3-methyl-5-hydroxy-6-metoxy-1,4-benzoquinol methylase